MKVIEILDAEGSRKLFELTAEGQREYVGSYATDLRAATAYALKQGRVANVIAIEKRTGVIGDGQQWVAWIEGKNAAGPFFGFSPASARLHAERHLARWR